jgi:hypothetical protein
MLKKNVKSLEEYYFQWMSKYEDDADRRLELLEKAYPYLVDYQHIFEGDTIEDLNMLHYFIEDVEKELSNEDNTMFQGDIQIDDLFVVEE